jgi:uncharacterized protein (DUF934 family)
MALIDSNAQIIEDRWRYPEPGGEAVFAPWHVVALAALTARGADAVLERPAGVALPADASAGMIAPFLKQLDLVVVQFPVFRDGRGFTIARTLREKHGFRGEIRAAGHVIPDQLPLLAQCGFSSIVTASEHPPAQWRAARAGAGQLLQRLVARV